jgi:hypothetical protein
MVFNLKNQMISPITVVVQQQRFGSLLHSPLLKDRPKRP